MPSIVVASLVVALTQGASAEEALARGVELFEQMRSEEALVHFDAALQADGLPADERAAILVWQGRARYEAGDEAGALASFERACTLAASVCDATTIASPRVRALFERARARAVAAAPTPTARAPGVGADVPDDDRPLSPARLSLLVAGGGALLVGAGGVGAGALLGVSAAELDASARDQPTAAEATALRRDAEGAALGANLLYAGGALLVVAGVVTVAVGALVLE